MGKIKFFVRCVGNFINTILFYPIKKRIAGRLQESILNKRRDHPIHINSLLKKESLNIYVSGDANSFKNNAEKMLCCTLKIGKIFDRYSCNKNIRDCDFLFAWVYDYFVENIFLYISLQNKPILFLEDGFLKGINNVFDDTEFSKGWGVSCFVDDLGFHFDSTRPSRLEMLLNSHKLVVTEEEKCRAGQIRSLIVNNKLTKYNHQKIYTPNIGRPGRRKVLVVEQSYRDSSVSLSNANADTFIKMLGYAIKQNPECDVIVKTHPDSILGQNGGVSRAYYANIKQTEQVYPIHVAVNPFSILEMVDKVYVCSSMLGLEALMAGKEVHVFGMPSYAGWGMTIDYQICNRRTNNRTLEEFIYIAYVLYAGYTVDGRWCEVEDAIRYLLEKRNKYFKSLNEGSSNV